VEQRVRRSGLQARVEPAQNGTGPGSLAAQRQGDFLQVLVDQGTDSIDPKAHFLLESRNHAEIPIE
jgi:hypothetical protein